MQVQIKFKRTGSNSVYGSFSAGDVMRCNQDVADHFISQGLAKYVEVVEEPAVEPIPDPVEEPIAEQIHQAKRGRKAKE